MLGVREVLLLLQQLARQRVKIPVSGEREAAETAFILVPIPEIMFAETMKTVPYLGAYLIIENFCNFFSCWKLPRFNS